MHVSAVYWPLTVFHPCCVPPPRPGPQEDVVVYEMNVRAFTADPSSGLEPVVRGATEGWREKVRMVLEIWTLNQNFTHRLTN